MNDPPIRVLFLCTGNSCRSQMAEGLARWVGKGRVESHSAGSDPRPVHPLAVRAVADIGLDISQQRSKPLDEFMGQRFDFVITVCDRAKESCPTLPNHREQIHWRVEDPAEANGTEAEVRQAFARTRDELLHRIRMWMLSHRIASK